ncbi:acetyltransferase [Lacipirellula parvula]|uniref:Acetyltransferase n=1 Tax=Lacipirellula parvula TaxID=2650471 RepID=A0A5K7XL22_9BACT|nr:acetyltransferase [Lacipirellula parvula]BBO35921.1 acetyltransferase [Lacipirellula parvula]
MLIREGRPADWGRLLEIWEASVRATHSFLSEEVIAALRPEVRDAALPALELWVLGGDGGELLGFMGLDGAKLEALFIAPSSSRRGGGRMLVEHARRLKGPLTVDVNEQNPAALRFYEALGFRVCGRSPVDGAGRPFPLLHLED